MKELHDAHVQAAREVHSAWVQDEIERQHAAMHDPETEGERLHYWQLLCLIGDKEAEIEKWEAMPEPLPSEATAKEQRLQVLRAELSELQTTFEKPYQGTSPPSNATGTGGAAPADPAGAEWGVNRPQRFQGYGRPLHIFLTQAKAAGKARPVALDVLEEWRRGMPPEVMEVTANELKYYGAGGDLKIAGLRAITKVIDRMTN